LILLSVNLLIRLAVSLILLAISLILLAISLVRLSISLTITLVLLHSAVLLLRLDWLRISESSGSRSRESCEIVLWSLSICVAIVTLLIVTLVKERSAWTTKSSLTSHLWARTNRRMTMLGFEFSLETYIRSDTNDNLSHGEGNAVPVQDSIESTLIDIIKHITPISIHKQHHEVHGTRNSNNHALTEMHGGKCHVINPDIDKLEHTIGHAPQDTARYDVDQLTVNCKL